MRERILILVAIFVLTVTAGVAQDAPPKTEPAPTPKPAVKRRTFDQFDLSNGVRSGPGTPSPTVIEFVDSQTYDGIARLVKYSASIETEYRSSEGVTIDPSDHFEPYRVLGRKLPALYRISEMFLAGLLDQPVMTNAANIEMLKQNQQIIADLQMISNSSNLQMARNQPKLVPIAERYGAPTYPVEKRPLMNAMFVRVNGNFSRLMSQVAVKK